MFKKMGVGCLSLIGLGVVVLVVIVAIIALGASKSTSSTSSKPQTGHVGRTVRIADNLDVTMTGYTLTNGKNVETPKAGQEWVVTHWKFHSFRSSNTDAASSGFKANAAGVITDPAYINSISNNDLGINGTALAPGASVRRDVVFEIPKHQSAKIIYQPDSSDNSRKATWTVKG